MIGLFADGVKARLRQRKPPYEDLEEQGFKFSKAWETFQAIPGNVTTTLISKEYATTSAKSKPMKPEKNPRRIYEEEQQRDEKPAKTFKNGREDSTSSEEQVKKSKGHSSLSKPMRSEQKSSEE